MKSKLIKNRERAKQLLAFDGMQYGKCRPTDIDMAVDFKGKVFIFCELKGAALPLTIGQRVHLEGLVKGLTAGGRVAYACLASHDTPRTEDDVSVAEATVVTVFDGKKWTPAGDILVNDWITGIHDNFMDGLI